MPISDLKTITSFDEKNIYFDSCPGLPSSEWGGEVIKLNEKIIENIVDKLVETKLKEFLKEKEILIEFRTIEEDVAQEEIEQFIIERNGEGASRISVFDIVHDLELPPEQVERIIEKFEKAGRLSETDD